MHRKVVPQGENTYIVSALQHENKTLKLSVFESSSAQQQVFVFSLEDVLTQSEQKEAESKPQALKELIKLAVNNRLKIREFESKNKIQFSASFLNPQVTTNQMSNTIALN